MTLACFAPANARDAIRISASGTPVTLATSASSTPFSDCASASYSAPLLAAAVPFSAHAVVEFRRADSLAQECLEDKAVLVRRHLAADAADRSRAGGRLDPIQPLRDKVERFIPRGRLELPILADQRRAQAGRAVHV